MGLGCSSHFALCFEVLPCRFYYHFYNLLGFVLRELMVGLFKFRIWICVRALAFMFVFLKDVSVICTFAGFALVFSNLRS